MKKTQKIKENINNYLFDHIGLKLFLDYFKSFILCIVSGFIFAFGFAAFITPQGEVGKELAIVTGGVSGISQNIYLAISFFNENVTLSEVTSICYFALNVPILIFAFFAATVLPPFFSTSLASASVSRYGRIVACEQTNAQLLH